MQEIQTHSQMGEGEHFWLRSLKWWNLGLPQIDMNKL